MRRFPRLFLSTLAALAFSTVAAAAPTVQLVDAGSGDMAVMRFAPKAGAKETVRFVLDADKGQDMGGDGKWTDLPPIAFELSGEVQAVETDGRIRYGLTLSDAELLPQDNNIDLSAKRQAEIDDLLKRIEVKLRAMEGATGTLELSPQGYVLSSDLAAPAGAEGTQFDDLMKALRITRTTFPIEPIGVGATWTAVEPVMERGMKVDQTITYRLKAFDGSVATITQTIDRKGSHESLAIKQEKLPPGTHVDLAALASGGEGETVVRLDRIQPTRGELSDSLEARVVVNKGGQVMQVGNTDKLALTVASE